MSSRTICSFWSAVELYVRDESVWLHVCVYLCEIIVDIIYTLRDYDSILAAYKYTYLHR